MGLVYFNLSTFFKEGDRHRGKHERDRERKETEGGKGEGMIWGFFFLVQLQPRRVIWRSTRNLLKREKKKKDKNRI